MSSPDTNLQQPAPQEVPAQPAANPAEPPAETPEAAPAQPEAAPEPSLEEKLQSAQAITRQQERESALTEQTGIAAFLSLHITRLCVHQ